MLTGKALGAAIDKAIQLKIESGAISSKADVAAHFRIRTPSIYDWIKKGSISKDKLPELWRYFSDVVDSTHWGLPDFPCPIGDAVHSPTTDNRAFVTKVTTAPAVKVETLDLPKIHEALEKLCEALGTSLKEVFENAPKGRSPSVRVHTPAVPKKNRPRKAGGTSSS